MIKLKINNIPIIIDFEHQNFQQEQHESKIPLKKQNRISGTYCTIEKEDKKYESFAQLSLKDNFHKAKGRRISLKKALSKTEFNKQERCYIWNEYFKICKK